MAQQDPARLCPVGELDLATCPQLEADIGAAFDAGARSLVLDLSQVSFLDSSGLQVIADAVERARGAGGTVTLEDASPLTRRTLRLVGLDRLVRLGGEAQPPR